MKNIKAGFIKIIVLSGFFLIFPNLLVISDTIVYKQVSGGEEKIIKITEQVSENGIIIIMFTEPDKKSTFQMDSTYAIQSWTCINSGENTDIVITRNKNEVIIDGKYRGNEFRKKTIMNKPWYQYAFFLKSFITGDGQAIQYHGLLEEKKLDNGTFSIKKMGEETIDVNGEKIETIKAKISFTGLMSMFWKGAECWFRKSDGILLLYKGSKKNKEHIMEYVEETE